MRRRSFWCAVALASLAAPLAAQQLPPAESYHVRVEYYQWHPTLTSQIQEGAAGQPGTLLDLKGDLGIADAHTFEIVATFQFTPGQKLRGSYTRLDYAGDTLASRTFQFNGDTYDVNAHVISSLKGAYYSADYEWDFVKNSGGYLGLMLGGKLISVDTTVSAPDRGVSTATTAKIPVPILGLAGRVYAGRFSLGGDASGLTIGKRGNLYELNGGVQFHISDRLAVEGGYRLLHIKGEKDLEFLSFQQSGWHVGGELSF
jgi:opacity protein-like surface antigen